MSLLPLPGRPTRSPDEFQEISDPGYRVAKDGWSPAGLVAVQNERRRLSRDLHDGLGPSLAGIQLQLDTARALLPPGSDVAGLLTGCVAALRDMVTQVRRIIEDLRPSALDELGLADAMRALAAELSHPSLWIETDLPPALPALPPATEVAIYRIVAEALTNVVRHSAATRATVSLTCRSGFVVVCVTDDGVGLPRRYRRRIGLRSIGERVAELRGECGVVNMARGTCLRVRLPLRTVD